MKHTRSVLCCYFLRRCARDDFSLSETLIQLFCRIWLETMSVFACAHFHVRRMWCICVMLQAVGTAVYSVTHVALWGGGVVQTRERWVKSLRGSGPKWPPRHRARECKLCVTCMGAMQELYLRHWELLWRSYWCWRPWQGSLRRAVAAEGRRTALMAPRVRTLRLESMIT